MAKSLSSRLDDIIQFKEKKKDPPAVAKAKIAGTLAGGYLGAYAGILRGVETGSMASGIEGVGKAMHKARDNMQQDAAREARKNAERYTEIEGPHGERIRQLKGKSERMMIGDKTPVMDRLKSASKKAGVSLREGATKARYAAEDALHGGKKWLTRSSLSRSAAVGALLGAGVGRYLGGKAGAADHRAKKERQARAKKTRERKQANELAKTQIMARTLAEHLNQRQLSSRLDAIINFDAPPIDSWNPIKRHKQHKALQQWVDDRPPSAGITAEHVAKQYPENKAATARQRKGALIGGGIGVGVGGALAGLAAATGRKGYRAARAIGTSIVAVPYAGILGAGIGSHVGDRKNQKRKMKEYGDAVNTLRSEIAGPNAVPVESLKSNVPRASTYREVTSQLKDQGVGPVSRHAVATITRPPIWAGDNAFFVNKGDKGLIITSKKVHPAVFRHEEGHAKDYAHYGGEKGFKKAYPKYGDPFASREDKIKNTLLAEHRAWEYAKPNKKDKKLKDAALTTYKHGLGLSSKLDQIINFSGGEAVGEGIKKALAEIARRNKTRGAGAVLKRKFYPKQWDDVGKVPYNPAAPRPSISYEAAEDRLARKMGPRFRKTTRSGDMFSSFHSRIDEIAFGDPRPRNPQGEFTGSDSGVPNPNVMAKTYGQNLAGGAVAGVGAGSTGFAVKSLLEKFKKARKKL